MMLDRWRTSDPPRATRSLGRSEEGRPIRVTVIGRHRAGLKVVVLAGQHGDEPLARRAAAALIARAPHLDRWANQVQLAVVADANPDGAARNSRCNARGIDLNRDHQLLRSAEVRHVHRLIRTWRPHLVIDLHTYPPRRKHLLALGLEYCHDVFIDWPSHRALARGQSDLLESLSARLAAHGHHCGRYTLVRRSGRIRHSTPDLIDARNGLAVRYGVATLLVEGRQPAAGEGPAERARTVDALRTTLEAAVDWSIANRFHFVGAVPGGNGRGAAEPPPRGTPRPGSNDAPFVRAGEPRPGDRIAIACRYRRSSSACVMAFRATADDQIRQVRLPGPYTPSVETTRTVRLPTAYAVPRRAAALLATLRRHGFRAQRRPVRGALVEAEQYQIVRLRPSRRAGRPPRHLQLDVRPIAVRADQYVLFSAEQPGGTALSLFLEPASKYGLARWPLSGLTWQPGKPYPVLRVR